jgi:hypothetical protein
MKNLKNLGEILNKKEQKEIFGGSFYEGDGSGFPNGDITHECGTGQGEMCPNGVNRQTGNYCSGVCVIAVSGNYCIIDPC